MSLLPKPDVYRHPPAILVSPGLYRDEAETPAFEVKFLLTKAEAQEVERRLRGRLAPDPHADPALGGAYRVTSVYFDTPNFDVYRRSPGYRRAQVPGPPVWRGPDRVPRAEGEAKATSPQAPRRGPGGRAGDARRGGPGRLARGVVRGPASEASTAAGLPRLLRAGRAHRHLPEGPIRVTFDREAHGGRRRVPSPSRWPTGRASWRTR